MEIKVVEILGKLQPLPDDTSSYGLLVMVATRLGKYRQCLRFESIEAYEKFRANAANLETFTQEIADQLPPPDPWIDLSSQEKKIIEKSMDKLLKKYSQGEESDIEPIGLLRSLGDHA